MYKCSKFPSVILFVILLSSLKLIFETYINELDVSDTVLLVNYIKFKYLKYFDYIINGIFIFEFIVKIIAMGFALDPGTYLRDNWNLLDFLIVVFSLIDMILSDQDL